MSWSVPLFFLLLGSIVTNFVIGNKIHEIQSPELRKKILIGGLAANLGVLAIFKYANFGIESALLLLRAVGLPPSHDIVVQVVLPIGISFYTFHAMSYVIDIYRRKYAPYGSFLDYFLYITFFPQLVAGPIVRADFFRRSLEGLSKPITWSHVSSGLFLFVLGMFKKSVLADNAAKISNLVFDTPGELSSVMVLLGLYAFAFQIYLDFSGYTDMARGLGRLLGVELPINFRMPYLSRGISEFWHRWHISLSTWLRDYLYISMGGSRGTQLQTYRNLMVTMLLGGLWHGASFNFIIWGGIHGVWLSIERLLYGDAKRDNTSSYFNVLKVFLTFHLVCFTWIFFRAHDVQTTMSVLGALATPSGYLSFHELRLFSPQIWGFGLVLPALFTFVAERWVDSNEIDFEMRQPLLRAIAFCGLTILILLTSGGPNEFIYFQF